MNTFKTVSVIGILILLAATAYLWQNVRALQNEINDLKTPDLYTIMAQMQNQVHKLTYSLDNENFELADFYLHELEEGAEALIEANVIYHDQPVGELTETMLIPVLEEVEDAVGARDIEAAREKTTFLIQSCNNCHVSAGYSEIIITDRAEVNPFNQDFRVSEP